MFHMRRPLLWRGPRKETWTKWMRDGRNGHGARRGESRFSVARDDSVIVLIRGVQQYKNGFRYPGFLGIAAMRTCPKCFAQHASLFRLPLPVWRCGGCGTLLIPNERRMNLAGLWGVLIPVIFLIWGISAHRFSDRFGETVAWTALIIWMACGIMAIRAIPPVVLTNQKKRNRVQLMKLGVLAPIGYGVLNLLPVFLSSRFSIWENLIFPIVLIALGMMARRAWRALAKLPDSPEAE